MKNSKLSVSVLAIVLAAGTAFAGVAKPAFATKKWARNPQTGVYTDITGQQKGLDYNCTASSSVCTATYQDNINPNTQPSATPVSQETGLFN